MNIDETNFCIYCHLLHMETSLSVDFELYSTHMLIELFPIPHAKLSFFPFVQEYIHRFHIKILENRSSVQIKHLNIFVLKLCILYLINLVQVVEFEIFFIIRYFNWTQYMLTYLEIHSRIFKYMCEHNFIILVYDIYVYD